MDRLGSIAAFGHRRHRQVLAARRAVAPDPDLAGMTRKLAALDRQPGGRCGGVHRRLHLRRPQRGRNRLKSKGDS